ncbi:MAG: hypothetical protein ACJAW3_000199 [Lentimonas sp.]|jgi:hypothetical protein
MVRKIILSLLIILTLSSCGRYWYKPYGKIFKFLPKEGSPGFKLGWLHGCESGLSTQFGGAIFLSFYQWKKDPDIAKSRKSLADISRIRERYKDEKIAKINWNNPREVKKNFSDYNTIFWSAHIFCRHSALGQLEMSGMRPPIVGDVRYDPGAHSIGNIYKIDGKGDARYSYW